MKEIDLVKLTFCGPTDVQKEIKFAQDIVTEWNLQNGETRGFWVKTQHWSTDSYPEMGERPQAIINRQIIDDSDIIVAIFWHRFGSDTGVAGSGTEEEILRAIGLGHKVMVYFSDLESPTIPTDPVQERLLSEFRRKLYEDRKGLYFSFKSRREFQRDFTRHLAQTLNELRPIQGKATPYSTQSIHGNNNIQAGRDINIYPKSPTHKTVIARRDGAISSAEAQQIKSWIELLVDNTTRMTRSKAFGMWWSRLMNKFKVAKHEDILSSEMVDVELWFKQESAKLTRGLRNKLPDEWRKRRYSAIHKTIANMGLNKEEYYHEIAHRLRMKETFSSLTQLTKTDLERVYALVMRDAKK